MIGVEATFSDQALANRLVARLARTGLNPNRLRISVTEGGEVRVTVEADESEYEALARLMREHAADEVELDMTGRNLDSGGRPSLTESEPPSPHDAG